MEKRKMNKQIVCLNELPQWSVWPARLLEIEPWAVPNRTIEKIDQEYDNDKYARCLNFCIQAENKVTYDAIKQFELGIAPDSKVCISCADELFIVSLSEAKAKYYQLLLDTVRAEVDECKTVVELGCGYGYNLWMLKQHFPTKAFIGGEYSDNAVQLSSRLNKYDTINVLHFNFYDEKSYAFLEKLAPPILILTSHAVEQLPSSFSALDALSRYREIIKTVFHFEPVFQLHEQTLLGLMRQRYAQINDYNRDLLLELKERPNIRILGIKANVVGLNPLNPTSVIQWEFNRT